MDKRWFVLGAALALCAVAAGALGDHLIRPKLLDWFPADAEKRISNWEVAGRYLFFHALAICLVGLMPRNIARVGTHLAGIAFSLGIVLFSGCLFAYVLTDHKWLVHLVPFGGMSFMIGWLALIVAVATSKGKD
jgi:uncharacterized membrane protein YgdD (TMEM256/DUF423 family)